MATQTNTGTARACSPRAPARLTKKQVDGWKPCLACHHLDLADTIAALDGVGWCQQYQQYRAVTVKRACPEFSNRFLTTED